jgi:hypothetical protein
MRDVSREFGSNPSLFRSLQNPSLPARTGLIALAASFGLLGAGIEAVTLQNIN